MRREAKNGALMERTADMRNCLWRSNADRKVGIFLMYIASGTGQAVPETGSKLRPAVECQNRFER
jgi:hypothetical protein